MGKRGFQNSQDQKQSMEVRRLGRARRWQRGRNGLLMVNVYCWVVLAQQMSHVRTDLPFPKPAPPAGFLIAALGSSILHGPPRNLTVNLPPAHLEKQLHWGVTDIQWSVHVQSVQCGRFSHVSIPVTLWPQSRLWTYQSPANALVTTGELPFSRQSPLSPCSLIPGCQESLLGSAFRNPSSLRAWGCALLQSLPAGPSDSQLASF